MREGEADGGSETPRAVIVVSSHVARGSVGNRAAVFALETLGFPVWAVPTVILPWHPGHSRATRIVPPPEQFAALMGDLESSPWLGEVTAVLSGYLGEARQADAVASLVRSVRARNPGATYVCDPVIGDAEGLYVPQATAEAIRDVLMPLADVATPNVHELAWLTGRPPGGITETVETAANAGPETMLVTSAPAAEVVTGNAMMTSSERQTALERISVRFSITNLRTFPCVSILETKGKLSLHGAWFDISTGELWVMDPQTGDFVRPDLD